jgi:hypothetical protein
MNCEIGSAIENRSLNLLYEHSFAAHGIDGNVETLIRHRLDDDLLDSHRSTIRSGM